MTEPCSPRNGPDDPAPSPESLRSLGVTDYAFRTSRLDEIETTLNDLVISHKLAPLTRGAHANSDFQFHGTENVKHFKIGYGRDVAVRFPAQENETLAFVMASRGQGRLTLLGEEFLVSDQQGVIFPSGPSKVLSYDDACDTQVLVLSRAQVAAHCAKLLGRDFIREVDFETRSDLDTAAGQNWLRLFDYAKTELSNPQSFVRHLDVARQQLEQMLITGLLFGHRHSYSDLLLTPQSPAAPFYVKRAEAYIEAHFAEPLSLADIAAHAGVSARALQNGFQNFRRMTPMAFLRGLRLRRAHEALQAADPTSATVTQIALACGFNHMGEFATAYRRRFGVSPSQTLARDR